MIVPGFSKDGRLAVAATAPRVVDDFRVWEAKLHFNPADCRSLAVGEWLFRLVTMVGRAEHQALESLKSALKINRDTTGQIIKAELLIPC